MMFMLQTFEGQAFDRAYAERRQHYHRVVEVTQPNGTGEAHPLLSPDDAFPDFEVMDASNLTGTLPKEPEMLRTEHAREALKLGLAAVWATENTRGYARGVPMGGDLRPGPQGASLTFMVRALRDPDGPNLDRIQIIKGWLDATSKTQEQIYDVACADRDIVDGACPGDVSNTVDVESATQRGPMRRR